MKLINLGEHEALAGLEKIVEPDEEPNGDAVNGEATGGEPPAGDLPDSAAPDGENPNGAGD